ncbi:MAG: type II secretion system F family protein [Castellaniella sp.]|uniref:type II secretion system F family protein n=1 Tax=Castellaniella sp. TaxID=1955812 RepID=UPI003A868237
MAWFWIGLCLAAMAGCLGLWTLGRPWAVAHGDARTRPPAFWWPWVQALAPWCEPFVTWRMRRELRRWGSRAGLASHWRADRWLAACVLAAGCGAGLAGVGAWLGAVSIRVGMALVLMGAVLGFIWPDQGLRRCAAARRVRMMRELPFMLDLLTLCVEAGLSLPAALQQVCAHAPQGPLRQSLRDAAALERTGMERSRWLLHWAEHADVPGVRALVSALAQADRMGMSLGPLLRAQAERQRSERFLRAEKLALEAPVRMLFPMVLCIFPCTFLVIGFPVAVKLLDAGF